MAELLGNEQEKNAGRRGNGLFEGNTSSAWKY
jgi:hypothetical protein